MVVCGAGLTTRLAPDVWSVPPSAVTDRLSYPLTYWNGLGITAAIGLVLLVHLTTSLREPRVIRVLAAALCPALVATAYFTFSRGGILAGLIGVVLVLLVARPAGLVTGMVPAGGRVGGGAARGARHRTCWRAPTSRRRRASPRGMTWRA